MMLTWVFCGFAIPTFLPFVSAGCNDLVDFLERPCDLTPHLTLFPGDIYTECNREINREDTIDRPVVDFPSAKPDESYALFMVDADAPSPMAPTSKYYLHMLLINIKGSDYNTADEVMDYVPPTPPKGSGVHRYQFFLFLQEGPLSATVSGRPKFNLEQFTKANNLNCLVASYQYRGKMGNLLVPSGTYLYYRGRKDWSPGETSPLQQVINQLSNNRTTGI